MSAQPSSSLSLDSRSLGNLQAQAAKDPKAAVRETAKQFEKLFMNELLKSMRQSTMASGLSDDAGCKMGTEMLDDQYAGKLSGLPGGLSDIIARQLERQMGMAPGPIPATGSANNTPAPLAARVQATRIPQTGAAGFVQQHGAAAEKAEQKTGIPSEFMIAQAAHETGWGRKEILHADGSPSFNLFGIKAGASWKGPVAEVRTTEYVDGKAQKVVQKFRAYASYEESFADYAKLISESPRYRDTVAGAKDAGSFAQGLQKAGYATDPAYAEKLTRVINTTLRLQRSLG
ncbi:flagellar assembly peptidoglycan hydrolase FlgJ [Rubrivivax gelatinosus]|uniref:Peptidoglycan hydrolase FlgJ n=1 Tax=Rubrivivax gelatinosus TaxID=28068 RepID=A0ABS1DV26_RUBGE|nr:flagellar assembly peptidoglycan hydrolase FlgJ [Rubrivivax gelatinosus]MBK1614512.1 flagellar assembly peptidoglycan hydrolase FlgJ [Rubrivivax gelatinosus]MBK1712981.1 flagellar assembly peptidoglycan hydrolase FlgJ [Rubrivivax gelatinosus]